MKRLVMSMAVLVVVAAAATLVLQRDESAAAQSRTLRTRAFAITVEEVTSGLEHPWALEFLPDGRMLVTERPGRLRIVAQDGALSDPLAGTPEVFARGQGGLLDVTLHPRFESNRYVYLSYAEPGEGGAGTALGRGRLRDGRLEDFQVIFRQQPKVDGSAHFGSRIVFAKNSTLFLTLGERFKFDPAQDLTDHLGTIVRLEDDGEIPDDNPFVGQANAKPEIWSYGHRNIESAAIHPESGTLWVAEMGPQGGDELNLPERGRNYGWPVVSWGEHYDGRDIPDPPEEPRFAEAIKHWTPVISPSGMTFYTRDAFPAWRGSVLIGGLSSLGIVRLEVKNGQVGREERIRLGARIREVAQGPDGFVYVLTDEEDGKLLRLRPQR